MLFRSGENVKVAPGDPLPPPPDAAFLFFLDFVLAFAAVGWAGMGQGREGGGCSANVYSCYQTLLH